MKPSQNTLESLSDITEVRSAGQIRRIGSQMLLALARKEVSAADIMAAAKITDSMANLTAVELKVRKYADDLRQRGSELVKPGQLGELDMIGPQS